MNKISPLILFASAFLLLAGCSNEKGASTSAPEASAAKSAPAAPAGPAATSAQAVALTGNQGRVISSIDVPGYSYIQVEKDGKSVWIAGTPVKVQPGEIISWNQAMVMKNFQSKTLGRTFDEVLFVSEINTPSSRAAATTPTAQPMAPPHAEQVSSQGSVVFVQNAANYTYLQIKTADNHELWLAAPETLVNVNDTIEWQGGSLMRDFKSNSLGKTFPEIYFVTAVQVKN